MADSDPPLTQRKPLEDGGERRRTTRRVETTGTRRVEKWMCRRLVLADGTVVAQTEPWLVSEQVGGEQQSESDEGGDGQGQSAMVLQVPDLMERLSLSEREGDEEKVVEDKFVRRVNTRHIRESSVTTANMGPTVAVRIRRRDLERCKRRNRQWLQSEASHLEGDGFRRRGPGQDPANSDVILHWSETGKKKVETEDEHSVARVTPGGKLRWETVKTQWVEEHDESADPRGTREDDGLAEEESEYERGHGQRYTHRKKDHFVDYYGADGNLVSRGPRAMVEERFWQKNEEGNEKEKCNLRVVTNGNVVRVRIRNDPAPNVNGKEMCQSDLPLLTKRKVVSKHRKGRFDQVRRETRRDFESSSENSCAGNLAKPRGKNQRRQPRKAFPRRSSSSPPARRRLPLYMTQLLPDLQSF